MQRSAMSYASLSDVVCIAQLTALHASLIVFVRLAGHLSVHTDRSIAPYASDASLSIWVCIAGTGQRQSRLRGPASMRSCPAGSESARPRCPPHEINLLSTRTQKHKQRQFGFEKSTQCIQSKRVQSALNVHSRGNQRAPGSSTEGNNGASRRKQWSEP